ncbi:MAG: LPS export ABC transporter permease LptF [Chromatiales bacterium]|nr:LPS export ABC transporter permease LptF [Chromatiales bacterium]
MLIARSIASEILVTLAAVTGVLLLILLGTQLVRALADAVSGKIAGDVVFQLLGLQTLAYLGPLLVPGMFIAIILTLGRMYRDHEVTALAACGVGRGQLFAAVLRIAIPVAILAGLFSLYLKPLARLQGEIIRQEQRELGQITALTPGRFTEISGRNVVVFAEYLDENGDWRNVFVRDSRGVTAADRARREFRPDFNGDYIVLQDGHRYEGAPGTRNFRIDRYKLHGIRVGGTREGDLPRRASTLSTFELLNDGSPAAKAELQSRLSAPVSTLLLALLAVPLSRTDPREGRYGRLLVALLVYILYTNLIGISESWMKDGKVPLWLGAWWVHAIMLFGFMLALGLGGSLGRRLRRWAKR